MKILFVTLEPPYPPNDGGIIRTYNLLKQLSREHDITLVSFLETEVDKKRMESLEPFCKEMWSVIAPGMPQRSKANKVQDLLTGVLPALYRYHSDEMRELLRGLARG